MKSYVSRIQALEEKLTPDYSLFILTLIDSPPSLKFGDKEIELTYKEKTALEEGLSAEEFLIRKGLAKKGQDSIILVVKIISSMDIKKIK